MPILRALRNFFRLGRAERELDSELRAHLDLLADEKSRDGLAPDEARRAARIDLGGLEQVKEEVRAARSSAWLELLWQDVRFGARMLRRNPGFTAVAAITLALGIGATAAIFSVLDGVVLKPLSYPRPEQLVSVELTPLALDPDLRGMAPEDYFVFREQNRTFQEFGIYVETDTDRDVNVTSFAEPERVHALDVTYGVLPVLGVLPAFGRLFSPSDDSPGAPSTVVLTYAYWQRRYGSDLSAIGKTIVVDGKPRQIIGVLPRDFRFLDMQDLALFLPLQLDRTQVKLSNFSYFGIARLKPGITVAEAGADVARMIPATFEAFPPPPGLSVDLLQQSRLSASVLSLKQDVVGNIGTLLWILMGGIAMVLLIASANVANLLLVRTEGRRHELTLRAALGAGRGRIAAQLFRESAILGLLGGVVGLGLAAAALQLLVFLAPRGLPRIEEIGLNPAALAFTLCITIFTCMLCGLVPVLKYAGARVGIPEGGRSLGVSRERHRARNLLVTVQIALALILLICSGLMIRTFYALARVNPGFTHPAELQTFRISISETEIADESGVTRLQQRIRDKLAAIPGVSAISFSTAVPMDGDSRFDNVFTEDRTYLQGAAPPLRHLLFVSPGYFGTLGIPLVAGRDLTWAETFNKVPVALVSENLAREYWRTPAEALGRHVRINSSDDWREVIGVVADVRDDGIDKPARTDVYWPVLLANFQGRPLRARRSVTFAVRSSLAGSAGFVNQMRRAVWSVDAGLPIANVYTMSYLYDKSMARTAFTLVMLAIAGAMALLLGTIGLYGVTAYSVSQRTREIGIRMALGAQRADALRLVLGEGSLVILVGLAIGLLASSELTRLLSSLLFGVTATDPLTFASVSLLLAVVALAASYLPARRAMGVDPLVALRHE